MVQKKEFPKELPFWGRLKIAKNRTTLVIDIEPAVNKNSGREEPGFVHREATHTKRKNFEPVIPNPDKDDPAPMYLRPPRKIPQRLVTPHNKDLTMPEDLKARYDKNNHKGEKDK